MRLLSPATSTFSIGATLLSLTVATSSCISGSEGGTGGTTSSSTTSPTSVSGSWSAGTGETYCGLLGLPCCPGDACSDVGLVCSNGLCAHSQPFGSACAQNQDCESNLCLTGGHCSKPCSGAADCPPTPEWSCGPLANYPGDMCQCVPSGPEACDGNDNDCNGAIDDGATCTEVGFTCQSGACACDPANLCNGACTDIATNLQNCGGCGVTCDVGAACSEGHCQTTLATGQAAAELAANGTHVYWTNNDGGVNNAVMKMPVGGGLPIALATGQSHPNHLALDANNVYWTDAGVPSPGTGKVLKVPLGGGATTVLASGQDNPEGIAVDAKSVYWVNGGEPTTVREMPLGGGPIVISPSGEFTIWNLAVTSTTVYVVGMGGMLTTLPVGGGTASERASQGFKGSRVNTVAVDATSVYWHNDESIMKMPLGGGAITILASGQDLMGCIAVDATHVYWTSGFYMGSVMKMPRGGGAATTIASGQPGPYAIAVDATSVYWSALDAVKRAPK